MLRLKKNQVFVFRAGRSEECAYGARVIYHASFSRSPRFAEKSVNRGPNGRGTNDLINHYFNHCIILYEFNMILQRKDFSVSYPVAQSSF